MANRLIVIMTIPVRATIFFQVNKTIRFNWFPIDNGVTGFVSELGGVTVELLKEGSAAAEEDVSDAPLV